MDEGGESASDALRHTNATPISQLRPETEPDSSIVIDGAVTITWPYSIITKSVAFILAEHDFLLRRDKGQLRVELHGASAQALSKCPIAGGDEVRLSLRGAEWEQCHAPTRMPAGTLDRQLKFSNRLLLEVRRAEGDAREMISVDVPRDQEPPPEPDVTPADAIVPDAPYESNGHVDATPSPSLPVKRPRPVSESRELDELASPAFIKRARVSYGSLYEDGFDIFDEKDVKSRKKLRSRFSLHSMSWRYTSKSPSPEADEVVNGDSGQGHDEGQDEESQTSAETPRKTVSPPRPPMVDGTCQTQESYLSPSEPRGPASAIAYASMSSPFGAHVDIQTPSRITYNSGRERHEDQPTHLDMSFGMVDSNRNDFGVQTAQHANPTHAVASSEPIFHGAMAARDYPIAAYDNTPSNDTALLIDPNLQFPGIMAAPDGMYLEAPIQAPSQWRGEPLPNESGWPPGPEQSMPLATAEAHSSHQVRRSRSSSSVSEEQSEPAYEAHNAETGTARGDRVEDDEDVEDDVVRPSDNSDAENDRDAENESGGEQEVDSESHESPARLDCIDENSDGEDDGGYDEQDERYVQSRFVRPHGDEHASAYGYPAPNSDEDQDDASESMSNTGQDDEAESSEAESEDGYGERYSEQEDGDYDAGAPNNASSVKPSQEPVFISLLSDSEDEEEKPAPPEEARPATRGSVARDGRVEEASDKDLGERDAQSESEDLEDSDDSGPDAEHDGPPASSSAWEAAAHQDGEAPVYEDEAESSRPHFANMGSVSEDGSESTSEESADHMDLDTEDQGHDEVARQSGPHAQDFEPTDNVVSEADPPEEGMEVDGELGEVVSEKSLGERSSEDADSSSNDEEQDEAVATEGGQPKHDDVERSPAQGASLGDEILESARELEMAMEEAFRSQPPGVQEIGGDEVMDSLEDLSEKREESLRATNADSSAEGAEVTEVERIQDEAADTASREGLSKDTIMLEVMESTVQEDDATGQQQATIETRIEEVVAASVGTAADEEQQMATIETRIEVDTEANAESATEKEQVMEEEGFKDGDDLAAEAQIMSELEVLHTPTEDATVEAQDGRQSEDQDGEVDDVEDEVDGGVEDDEADEGIGDDEAVDEQGRDQSEDDTEKPEMLSTVKSLRSRSQAVTTTETTTMKHGDTGNDVRHMTRSPPPAERVRSQPPDPRPEDEPKPVVTRLRAGGKKNGGPDAGLLLAKAAKVDSARDTGSEPSGSKGEAEKKPATRLRVGGKNEDGPDAGLLLAKFGNVAAKSAASKPSEPKTSKAKSSEPEPETNTKPATRSRAGNKKNDEPNADLASTKPRNKATPKDAGSGPDKSRSESDSKPATRLRVGGKRDGGPDAGLLLAKAKSKAAEAAPAKEHQAGPRTRAASREATTSAEPGSTKEQHLGPRTRAASREAAAIPTASPRAKRRLATPEMRTRELRSKSHETGRDATPEAPSVVETPLKSPSTTGSIEDDETAALKRELNKTLRTALAEFAALRSLRMVLGKTVDVLAVATATPPPASRPKSGPRDYMLELVLTDTSTAPTGVVVAHLFRPHLESLPVVKAGDVTLLRRVQVVSIKGRGFGVRGGDASAWAVFEKDDEEGLAQIRGPPVEVAAEEAGYADGLRRWWTSMEKGRTAMGRVEKATQKALQRG